LARGHLLPRYFKGETKVLQALFIVLVPAGILYLSRRNKFIGLVGPILLSYIAGILIGNLGLELNEGISMQISEIAVPVAIPFILYSVDIKKWLKMTNKTIKSFMLVITSFENKTKVSPKQFVIDDISPEFEYNAPKYSFSVIRIGLS
jgi:hypothetical protein